MIRVRQGHTTSTLYPLATKIVVEDYPTYDRVTDSTGIARNTGGAEAVLHASAISYDEMDALLYQFGLSLYTPAALITVEMPDYFRIPTRFYGVAEIEMKQVEGDWWKDVRIKLHNLIPYWQVT